MCYNTSLQHHQLQMFQQASLNVKRMKEIENHHDSESLQLRIQKQLHTKVMANDPFR